MKTRLSNFGAVRLMKAGRAAYLSSRITLVLLLVLCSSHFAAASATTTASVSRGLPFAVADFDGDHQPDLASVQAGSSSSSDYWVRFRLSATGRHYVRITGPEGGLLVEARDVNGDQLPDLIVASAWLDRPVAILLNDGHGNFSEVAPSAFPEAFPNSSAGWNISVNPFFYPGALPRDSSSGENSLVPCVERLLRNKGFLRFQSLRMASIRPTDLRAGRAPPAVIFL